MTTPSTLRWQNVVETDVKSRKNNVEFQKSIGWKKTDLTYEKPVRNVIQV